jgi:23S rRNA (cytidine1920-2'-O)/16S rRNA (cytidine1409-2'-O)-methyltransferase
LLVERGLATSRQQAAALVAAGQVTVGGAPADKAARLVARGEPIEVLGPGPRYVSRGGEKLEAGLAAFAVPVEGARVLDAGASTGGFTDCLLQRGAASVVAVDVGHGQLHERLRRDPRVICHERCDIRSLTLELLGGAPVDVVVADLAFISATRAVPVLVGTALAPGGHLVVLVKPQFEAGRAEVSRGRGVVTDPEVHRRALVAVASSLVDHGAVIMGVMPSPITGASGNVEFLVHARRALGGGAGPGPGPASVAALVDAAVTAVHGAGPSAEGR